MYTINAAPDDQKYATAAARMLSGMVLLYLLAAGAAAILAFATAAIVLMLHRERDYGALAVRISAGIATAAVAWILLYCRSTEMRMIMPLSHLF